MLWCALTHSFGFLFPFDLCSPSSLLSLSPPRPCFPSLFCLARHKSAFICQTTDLRFPFPKQISWLVFADFSNCFSPHTESLLCFFHLLPSLFSVLPTLLSLTPLPPPGQEGQASLEKQSFFLSVCDKDVTGLGPVTEVARVSGASLLSSALWKAALENQTEQKVSLCNISSVARCTPSQGNERTFLEHDLTELQPQIPGCVWSSLSQQARAQARGAGLSAALTKPPSSWFSLH